MAEGMWKPSSVVERHRKTATAIWVSLLLAFFAYIWYIVWDTIDARSNPAASVELKQSPFTFPDVAICTSFLNGCLSTNGGCLSGAIVRLLSQTGFREEADEFIPEDDPDVNRFRDSFSSCAVMPLSKLTVNETGVDNGDITFFSASFYMIWNDDPSFDFSFEENGIFTQYVSAHFIDVQQDVDQIAGSVVDVMLPYERLVPEAESVLTATRNHVVVSMAEFSGITKNGGRKERERTYSQSTTTGKQNWYWDGVSDTSAVSVVQVEMLINKFEFTTVQEVDPVDLWAIIGAIGGVWQFVVVAFGLFFVFSEKQPPDRKMRSFRDTVVTPAVTFNRRLSSMTSSSRSSQQDIELEAADEDLPPGWVKRQRKRGIVYYYHTGTGATSQSLPHETEGSSASMGATPARRSNALRNVFTGAFDAQGSGGGGVQDFTNGRDVGGNLPPGWVARNENGQLTYHNTDTGITQVTRPPWRPSGSGDQAVNTPGRQGQDISTPGRRGQANTPGGLSRRGSRTILPRPSGPPAVIPPDNTALRGGVVDNPLPPNWHISVKNGNSCFRNNVTREVQWNTP